ncbi:DUF6944 family repetitive protein [Evansella halocellulosilytica]|uniref:DUF6944 family repetitive protein n=1 Tax=Evansella halocellulosilytica TaxID=2011013 RepID=UPI000BB76685|nr:hypothetical protein [Evansella halocellulosilytica]
MTNSVYEIVGGWTQAVGNIIAATASTVQAKNKQVNIRNEMIIGQSFQAIGNLIQASGKAIEEDLANRFTRVSISGNIIGASGNTLIVSEELKNVPTNILDENMLFLGNALQSLGAYIEMNVIKAQEAITLSERLNIKGNALQSVGALLQAIVYIRDFEINDPFIAVLGSWIQASGAVLSAIASGFPVQLDESSHENFSTSHLKTN